MSSIYHQGFIRYIHLYATLLLLSSESMLLPDAEVRQVWRDAMEIPLSKLYKRSRGDKLAIQTESRTKRGCIECKIRDDFTESLSTCSKDLFVEACYARVNAPRSEFGAIFSSHTNMPKTTVMGLDSLDSGSQGVVYKALLGTVSGEALTGSGGGLITQKRV